MKKHEIIFGWQSSFTSKHYVNTCVTHLFIQLNIKRIWIKKINRFDNHWSSETVWHPLLRNLVEKSEVYWVFTRDWYMVWVCYLNQQRLMGNFMSNHPGHDTLTSQILSNFSLFADSVEMINLWKFQPSTPYGFEVIEIWNFERNGSSGVKPVILNLRFL